MSQSRKGYARVNVSGRTLALEANQHLGPHWRVEVVDLADNAEGSVMVHANSASEAIWRVARAVVRAVAEATGGAAEDTAGTGT